MFVNGAGGLASSGLDRAGEPEPFGFSSPDPDPDDDGDPSDDLLPEDELAEDLLDDGELELELPLSLLLEVEDDFSAVLSGFFVGNNRGSTNSHNTPTSAETTIKMIQFFGCRMENPGESSAPP